MNRCGSNIFYYLNNLLHGDFGPSYNLPDFTVAELFAEGLPVSIQLGATRAGAGAVVRRRVWALSRRSTRTSAADYAVIATATAGSTIPTFVIAPLFQLVFGLTLEVAAGRRLGRRRADQQGRARSSP